MNDDIYKLYTHKEVSNLIAKSVSNERKRTKANWGKAMKSIKNIAIAIALLIVILTSLITLGITSAVEASKANDVYATYSAEAESIVNDAYEGSINVFNGNVNSDYNARELASYIVENRETFDITMYQIYNKVKSTHNFSDAEVRNIMNHILVIIKDITKGEYCISFADFEEYVINLGFITDEGKADYNAYCRYMDKVIVEIAEAEQAKADALENHGIGGR